MKIYLRCLLQLTKNTDILTVPNLVINKTFILHGSSQITEDVRAVFNKSISLAVGKKVKNIIFTLDGKQYIKTGNVYNRL